MVAAVFLTLRNFIELNSNYANTAKPKVNAGEVSAENFFGTRVPPCAGQFIRVIRVKFWLADRSTAGLTA